MQVYLLGLCCALFLQIKSGSTGKGFFSSLKAKNSSTANIALHKPANQDSTYKGDGFAAGADKAVDGDANDVFKAKSCTHTWGKKPGSVWWEVDLQHQFRIGSIRIHNRDHQRFYKRLHDVAITVYQNKSEPREKKHCTTHVGPAGRGWLNLTCDSPVTGRYVRISKPVVIDVGDQLCLCEVEMYEASSPPTSLYFERKSVTSTLTGNEKQMVKSPLHCATICAIKGSTGFVVEREKIGDMTCLIIT